MADLPLQNHLLLLLPRSRDLKFRAQQGLPSLQLAPSHLIRLMLALQLPMHLLQILQHLHSPLLLSKQLLLLIIQPHNHLLKIFIQLILQFLHSEPLHIFHISLLTCLLLTSLGVGRMHHRTFILFR